LELSVITESNIEFTAITCPESLDWTVSTDQSSLLMLRALAALRDTLLPKLISGELRVPDVEKILEERGL